MATKYAPIYKNTYWGGFKLHQCESITNEIINNRNLFIEDYNIIKNRMRPPLYINKEHSNEHGGYLNNFDHVECYMDDNDNYVLISSPYYSNGDQYDLFYIGLGWTRIYPLYSIYAATYVKIIFKKYGK